MLLGFLFSCFYFYDQSDHIYILPRTITQFTTVVWNNYYYIFPSQMYLCLDENSMVTLYKASKWRQISLTGWISHMSCVLLNHLETHPLWRKETLFTVNHILDYSLLHATISPRVNVNWNWSDNIKDLVVTHFFLSF